MKITLKEKKLADGRISLYIESFKGSTVDEKTGKRVHLRDFEFLKLYLHPNPKTARKKRITKKHCNLPRIFWHSVRVSSCGADMALRTSRRQTVHSSTTTWKRWRRNPTQEKTMAFGNPHITT